MSGQFDADAMALRAYADDLGRYAGVAGQFGQQVAQADVGDASWGIVGLFAKDKYTETIRGLQDFLRSAESYATGLDERMRAAGDTYDEMDNTARTAMDLITKGVGATSPRPGSAYGSGSPYYGQGPGGDGGSGEFANFGSDTYTQSQEQQLGSQKQDVGNFIGDASSFVSECYGAMQGIATNPLQWLVNMGLGFLLEVVQPLQDLLEMVSGDPQALEQASTQFLNIEQGLLDMRHAFDSDTRDKLRQWAGVAAQNAKKRLTEFSVGTGGAAERSGSLAELLAVSAIVMEVIYDLIKSILSELITFLIELWLPALAAAVTSFGASVAAATGITAVKTTSTVATTTKKVTTLADLLQKLVQVFIKLAARAAQKYFKFQGDAARMRADRQAARDGQRPGTGYDQRPYQPNGPGYGDRPDGWRQPDTYYPDRPGFDTPDYDIPGYDRPDYDTPDYEPAGVGGAGGSGFRPGDFDSTGAAGLGGGGAGGFGPSAAGGLPGGGSMAAGAQSGAAQMGAAAAAGAAGGASAGGAAGGGMMGGAPMGGAGRGQGGDGDRQRKSRVQGDAKDLFGNDEMIAPPVIGEEK